MINNFVPGALAQFDFPRGIALDTSLRRLYVVDYNNHAIRYIQLEPAVAAREPSTPTPSANKLSSRWAGKQATSM
ncbi:MAG: hypothetical protein H6558_08335 [Lewinellaceae bacterium]|nr:hypothetical protein [Lewinellaceae bacterium]